MIGRAALAPRPHAPRAIDREHREQRDRQRTSACQARCSVVLGFHRQQGSEPGSRPRETRPVTTPARAVRRRDLPSHVDRRQPDRRPRPRRSHRARAFGLERLACRSSTHARTRRRAGARGPARRRHGPGISIGGDGTLREVLADSPASASRSPSCRSARPTCSPDLGLPHDVAALRRSSGRTTALDVATSASSFGHRRRARTPTSCARSNARRGPISKLDYVPASACAASLPSAAPEVELDGQRHPARSAFDQQRDPLRRPILPRPTARDDGLFEVYLFREARPLAMALRCAASSATCRAACRMRRARSAGHFGRASCLPCRRRLPGETPPTEVSSLRRRILIP